MLAEILRNGANEWPFILLLLLLSWVFWSYLTTPKNLPPGPRGLPLIGFIPYLGEQPHVTLANLKKEYGEVSMVYLGPFRTIVLNSFNAVKTALVKQADVFSSRSVKMMIPPEFRKEPGIIFNTGEMWTEFRRFSLSTLREFGLGKSIIETRIKDEIDNFISQVKMSEGKPVDIGDLLRTSITNVICATITGKRYEYDDPFFKQLIRISDEYIQGTGIQNLEVALPDLLRKPKFLKLLGITTGVLAGVEMKNMLDTLIDKYVKDHEPGSKDNFIDAWLTEMEKSQKKHFFNARQLSTVLMDLFIAGSDTTSNTIRWGLLYMMKHPEIQQKVQKEIDDVIGRERTPSMMDQKDMPYTEATLMEISRIATIVPLSVFHCAEKDATLNGYFIPKGTLVIPNLWAVHHDPETFTNPFEFTPERFLTDNQQIKKMEQLIPFSMGKRQCMGETLARMELFLYFTSILQTFNIKKVEGSQVVFDQCFSIISVPKPYKLCAVLR